MQHDSHKKNTLEMAIFCWFTTCVQIAFSILLRTVCQKLNYLYYDYYLLNLYVTQLRWLTLTQKQNTHKQTILGRTSFPEGRHCYRGYGTCHEIWTWPIHNNQYTVDPKVVMMQLVIMSKLINEESRWILELFKFT